MALTVRFHETLFFSSRWVGKDPRTWPATLELGKIHMLAVAALRRQLHVCRLRLSCAQTDYADKYTVSIWSILTLPNSDLFQLTDLFSGSCHFLAFPLPPSASYQRELKTAKQLYFTAH